MNGIDLVDRRSTLRACALAIAGTSGAGGLAGCGHLGRDAKAEFSATTTEMVTAAADELAATLGSLVTVSISNERAQSKILSTLQKRRVAHAAVYGAIDDSIDQFGHQVLFNLQPSGYLKIEIHNDKKYIEPLVVRKGTSPLSLAQQAGSCCFTNICTSTIDTHGGEPRCDFTDQGGEDPCPGLIRGFNWGARAAFQEGELGFLGEAIRGGCEALAAQRLPVKAYQAAKSGAVINYGETRFEGGRWRNWLIRFANGSSAIVQAISGPIMLPVSISGKKITPESVLYAFLADESGSDADVVYFPQVISR